MVSISFVCREGDQQSSAVVVVITATAMYVVSSDRRRLAFGLLFCFLNFAR
jgi:hypothetical protein